MSEQDFLENEVALAAVERWFITIGEALVRLKRDDPGLCVEVEQERAVRRFRNVLVHQYDIVRPVMVYHIAVGDVPYLIRQVETMLERLGKMPDS